MLELWQELRPSGELAEHEADQRGRRYQEQRAKLEPAPRHPAETNVAELIAQEIEDAKNKATT